MAEGRESLGGDAAICCSAKYHFLLCRHQCCELGRLGQQALGLWGGVAAAAVVPDVISYNAAISACVKGQQWQQA